MIARSSPPGAAEVIVVGGGPAGATAARRLAIGGARVVVLDKAAFPRNKPCGGGISARALGRFPYLDDALSRISTHWLSRLHLEGPGGRSALVTSGAPAALMIRRVELDAQLVRLAVDAGASLVTGADIVRAREHSGAVELTARDGRVFSAPLVIAADGVHSIVARRLGLNRGWPAGAVALDMMEETPRTALRDTDPSTLWVAYGYGGGETGGPTPAPEGYAYIFPKRDHVNIGIGYVLDYYRRSVGDAPYDLQRRFVADLRARGVVSGESSRACFTPFLIPVGGPLPQTGRGRVVLAGDAGGFVNGFTAEGIYYAMVTGELAARAALGHLASGAPFAAGYRALWRREVGAELRDSVLIQRYLFADRARIEAAIEGARRESAITRLVLEFAVGRRTYRSLRRAMLARSPALAVRLLWAMLRGTPAAASPAPAAMSTAGS